MAQAHPARSRFALPAASLLLLLGACGGGGGAAPETLTLTADAATLKVGGETRLSATDGQGRPVAVTYQVLDGAGGTVDATGRFTASAVPGPVRVQARGGGGATAIASLTVQPYQVTLTTQPAMAVTRFRPTADLLADGSVLVVGGPESARAERYVPAQQRFLDAGDTGTARTHHTASPLPGGALLVAGGLGPGAVLASTLQYKDGAFTQAATLAAARYDHQATVLGDGRVLVTGGLPLRGSDVQALAGCEVYDPVLQRFTSASALARARAGHTATRLKDGRVLVVGGRDSTCLFTCPVTIWRSAELFDPATGTWSDTGSMAQGRTGHTATLLPDGRVLIAGGTSPDLLDTDVSSLVEVWDPATGVFTVAGNLLRPRSNHTATLLGDGTLLLAGGLTYGEGTLATATAEAFDPRTGQSRLAVSDLTTRYGHAAVRLPSGHLLLLGGSEGGGALKLVERID
ncbi:Kelch repeat-containing protein [Mesoterricola sediminis]|uniref:Uncharacterized protein n=1 Tax=Mesoterricola sediminis TaxID=2927980 RepID=A0AA48GWM7_9BACT|nr:kelch repeat-containing protein [Mesoterricola sediminis]BDU77020.1 hypothetical protein METESE_19780 [Mesoterricola sediminis]